MDKGEEILEILEELSPMPSDDDPELTPERLDKYAEVIREAKTLLGTSSPEKEKRLLLPLIRSFGYGDGYGTYWVTLSTLEKFPVSLLRPALVEQIRNGQRGARMWCAYMLGRIRDPRDTSVLLNTLKDPEPQVRIWALKALAMIGDLSAKEAMEELYDDPIEEVRKAAIAEVSALSSQQ